MRLSRVQENYDRAARSYDRWNHAFFDRLLGLERQRVVTIERLGDLHGKRVLDIGCGTGLNLPHLVDRVGATGEIIGVDYSGGMLAQARQRVAQSGWENVRLVQGDAVLDGIEGPFDAVLSTWAMGIVHDLPAALRRVIALLAPGGRIAILDFDRTIPDHWLRRLLLPLTHRVLLPLTHRVLLSAGFDDPEDLDDARLQQRWAEGKALLREGLEDLEEERYFQTGILLSGRKP